MEERIEKVLKGLKRNNMNGMYFETMDDAVKYIESQLFEGAVICAGGSVTVYKSPVWELISRDKYDFRDRFAKGITPEQQLEVFRSVVGCDFYFCSSNAVTENGELINVDGFSNRVSAIVNGPERVIMMVGINKIVKDIDEGFLRVKQIAAPKNAKRLKKKTPCVELGKCVALCKCSNPDLMAGCDCEDRICRNYVVSGKQAIKDRINVLIINEELGY